MGREVMAKEKTIKCPWCEKGIRKDNGRECTICDGLGNYKLSQEKRAKDR